MPISEKILNRIQNLNEDSEFKKLLISILEIEDKGSKVNINYEKAVSDYIEKTKEDEEVQA